MSGNKLWSKESTNTSQLIEAFTVGRDKDFDVLLAEYDVLGSLAHTEMLESVGLLSAVDKAAVHKELNNILQEIRDGKFVIEKDIEDVHSQVEWMLTQRIGEAGKKIHSGRSRNDQVAVDIKLYLRHQVLDLKAEVQSLFELLIQLSEQFKDKLLPGYTHLQIAMPSSFGLWFGAYAEGLVDDMELLAAA
jgi:argininosuccinate lyase